jgi:hypothetical protein
MAMFFTFCSSLHGAHCGGLRGDVFTLAAAFVLVLCILQQPS